ncbi:TPA: hypothetical protein ACX6SN_003254 [Photobacterium damselae]
MVLDSIKISSPLSTNVLAKNAKVNLETMGVYRDGSRHSLTKSVNDNQVATVNDKGQVQALGVEQLIMTDIVITLTGPVEMERGRSRSFHVSAVFVQTVQIWGAFLLEYLDFIQSNYDLGYNCPPSLPAINNHLTR